MTAFIDCMVCAKRLIDQANTHETNAEFTTWAATKGWTILPTRCPEHAKAEGQAVVSKAYADTRACTLDHDPNPWVVEEGLMVGGRSVPGGGATAGRRTLRPRPGFCAEHAHYWIFDHHTVPGIMEPETSAPEGAAK